MTPIRIAIAWMLLSAGCSAVQVFKKGQAFPGAEVFMDGQSVGTTDKDGMVFHKVPKGARITARVQVYQHPAPRADHASWVMRAYNTSVRVRNDGTLDQYIAPFADGLHKLTIAEDNPAIGLHILVSANWDMSQAEIDDLSSRFEEASQRLYNATDGQIYFEKIEIADQGVHWGTAEYDVYADNTVHPFSMTAGGFLSRHWMNDFGRPSVINLPRKGSYGDQPETFIHEFGHLGFGLIDEYGGTSLTGNYCSVNVHTSGSPYDYGNAVTSCVMDQEFGSPKFCSAHQDNPHKSQNWQDVVNGHDCWAHIKGAYDDAYTSSRSAWKLSSPVDRGIIVGRIQPAITKFENLVPPEWRRKNSVDNQVWPGKLCEKFKIGFSYSADGSPAADINVVLAFSNTSAPGVARIGPWISEGQTNSQGEITIVGAHEGDVVQAQGGAVWGVSGPRCVATQ